MSDTEVSRVEAFLADVSKQPQQRGNLIFALDATAYRERTWDIAASFRSRCFVKRRLSDRLMSSSFISAA